MRRAAAGLIALPLLLAACGSIGSPPASGSPAPTAGSSADPDAIYHRAGPTDVVLRFEEGGGFVPMGFFATQAPQFTLFGDGTVIFQGPGPADGYAPGPIVQKVAFLTAHLSEPEIQALLHFALDEGGVAQAGPSYSPGNIADAPTAIFTIHAGGIDKTVSVEALGIGTWQGPDAPIMASLGRLGERMRDYTGHVVGETTWAPDRWRGVLTTDAYNTPVAWPWSAIAPADFVQRTDPDAPRFPTRTLSASDVAALGMGDTGGGFFGLALSGPDGKTYSLAIRPLLPDETQ